MTLAGLKALSSSFLFYKTVYFQLISYNINLLIIVIGKQDVSWELEKFISFYPALHLSILIKNLLYIGN